MNSKHWPENYPVMHIHAQTDCHADAFIVGTIEGLVKLKEAIEDALKEESKHQQASLMCDDGEGYFCIVRCVSGSQMEDIPHGYTQDYAKDERNMPDFVFGK